MIYQLATEEGKYPYHITTFLTSFHQAPSQRVILRQLTQNRLPANARQDTLANILPEVAIWIDDGLELEDDQ